MDQPYFYFQGRRFDGLIGEAGEFNHYFGHSEALKIEGHPANGPLHQLVTLDLRDPVLGLNWTGIQLLPLVYGFHFQWGSFEYEVLDTNQIRITELDTSSFDRDWPYENYPAKFSKIPMSLSDFQQSSLETASYLPAHVTTFIFGRRTTIAISSASNSSSMQPGEKSQSTTSVVEAGSHIGTFTC